MGAHSSCTLWCSFPSITSASPWSEVPIELLYPGVCGQRGFICSVQPVFVVVRTCNTRSFFFPPQPWSFYFSPALLLSISQYDDQKVVGVFDRLGSAHSSSSHRNPIPTVHDREAQTSSTSYCVMWCVRNAQDHLNGIFMAKRSHRERSVQGA
ncbi:hypothetical protein VTO42DRAFT_4331 [Malbranchea cinnamomea]